MRHRRDGLHHGVETLKLIPTRWVTPWRGDLETDTNKMGYTWHIDLESDTNKMPYTWRTDLEAEINKMGYT